VNDADTRRRALARERRRKHRALRKRGKGAYYVRPHVERLALALIKSGLSVADAADHAKVEASLDLMVNEWVAEKLRS
jgi:hypothetical protein